MRSISWSSIRLKGLRATLGWVGAASATFASPAAGQYFDIYGEANRTLPAAQAAYDNAYETADPESKAKLVSDLIMGLIGKAKYKEAHELYLANADLNLHPDAVIGAIGHGLVAFVDDEEVRADYKARLFATVESQSCAPCYARTFAAHHLARYFFNKEEDLPKSVEWHKRALDLSKKDLAPRDPARVNFAYQYASYLRNLDLQAAEGAVRETEAMALDLLPREDHIGWLYVFLNNALVALDKGRITKAGDLFARITDIAVAEWGETDPQLISIYQNTAVLLSRSGRTSQAVEVALRAEIAGGYSDDRERGYHRNLIARLLVEDERLEEAVSYFRQALAYLESNGDDTITRARAQSDLARALSLLGQHEEALELIGQSLPAYRAQLEITNAQRRLREQLAASVYARAGDVPRAVATLEPVVTYNEGVMLDVYARDQDRVATAADGASMFEDSMAIALMDGDLERAWRSAQLSVISDLALAAKALTYPGDAAGFANALEAVRAARLEEDEIRAKLANAEANASDFAAARTRREQAEAALETGYPDFAQVLRPRPFTIDEAKAILRENEAFIVPVVYPDRLVTIALTRDGLFWGSASTELFRGRQLIRAVRASLEDGLETSAAFDAAAAHELYSLIFTPKVKAATAQTPKLIFPSAGALVRIPPAVLVSEPPEPGQAPAYLIRDHAVVVTSSLGGRAEAQASQAQRFAGIGAPVLGEVPASRTALRGSQVDIDNLLALPSLPGALAELEALKAAFSQEGALLLTGQDATENSVRSAELSDFQVVAFATHGLVSGQIDGLTEPALVMTPAPGAIEASNDGLLTASEIAKLKLAAEWIILSACNTAASDGRGKATYSGLAKAFQLTGARTLLLSHWPVRDDAATFLTVATVNAAAQGTERSEALRQAQLALIGNSNIDGASSPSIWAPFVLIE